METPTQGQEIAWITARHGRMISAALSQIEAALPEGTQCDSLKKLIQVPLYAFRQEVFEVLTGKVDVTKD